MVSNISGANTNLIGSTGTGNLESIYVETCEQVQEGTPYLPGCRGPADGVIYNATDNVVGDFLLRHCTVQGKKPIPTSTVTTIPFLKGQKSIDFQADLIIEAQGFGTSVTEEHVVTFGLVLPPGFTATSVLPFKQSH